MIRARPPEEWANELVRYYGNKNFSFSIPYHLGVIVRVPSVSGKDVNIDDVIPPVAVQKPKLETFLPSQKGRKSATMISKERVVLPELK